MYIQPVGDYERARNVDRSPQLSEKARSKLQQRGRRFWVADPRWAECRSPGLRKNLELRKIRGLRKNPELRIFFKIEKIFHSEKSTLTPNKLGWVGH